MPTAPPRWQAPGIRFVIVISPHLDDAVFSCGALLAAHPGSVVVTVFAGTPAAPDGLATDWDRRTGFENAGQAMRARRDEDRAALALLGGAPHWLAFLDSQYGGEATVRELAAGLGASVAALTPGQTDRLVAAPMGLFHGDHLRVHDAAVLALQDEAQVEAQGEVHGAVRDGPPGAACELVFYEDVPYRGHAGLLQGRFATWAAQGRQATPAAPGPTGWSPLKQRAMDCYASQWQALGEGARADARQPERYWRLGRVTA